MKPGHTTRELVIPTGETVPALLMSLSEIRDEIGLFDDDSQDAMVFDHIRAATEQCAVILGQDPRPADVVDRFEAPRDDSCLELSRGWIDSGQAITVKYLDAARVSRTMDAADWYLDDTGPRPVVVLSAAPAVHPVLAYPVSVSWRSALTSAHRGYETLRQAIRYLTGLYFEARGAPGSQDVVQPSYAIGPVTRMLRQHRP